MLSQKILNNIKFSRNKVLQSTFLPFSSSTGHNNENLSEDNLKPERKLKEWRAPIEPQRPQPYIPITPETSLFSIMHTDIQLTPRGLKKFFAKKSREREEELQQFIPKRHEILGADLATGHFLCYLGGKVKYKNIDKWITLNKDKRTIDLPNRFDPNYVLVEIDASNILLYYVALENFQNLGRVRSVNFSNSPLFNDWYVDRISSLFPQLEYLDISDCPKVTERGLEALYRTANLKNLIVTNHHKSAAFELTCMMLEDVVPGLVVNIREPSEKKDNNVK